MERKMKAIEDEIKQLKEKISMIDAQKTEEVAGKAEAPVKG